MRWLNAACIRVSGGRSDEFGVSFTLSLPPPPSSLLWMEAALILPCSLHVFHKCRSAVLHFQVCENLMRSKVRGFLLTPGCHSRSNRSGATVGVAAVVSDSSFVLTTLSYLQISRIKCIAQQFPNFGALPCAPWWIVMWCSVLPRKALLGALGGFFRFALTHEPLHWPLWASECSGKVQEWGDTAAVPSRTSRIEQCWGQYWVLGHNPPHIIHHNPLVIHWSWPIGESWYAVWVSLVNMFGNSEDCLFL